MSDPTAYRTPEQRLFDAQLEALIASEAVRTRAAVSEAVGLIAQWLRAEADERDRMCNFEEGLRARKIADAIERGDWRAR